MEILIITIIVVVSFVLGISLIVSAFKSTPDPDSVVHKNEFEAVRSELDVTKDQENQLKLKLDNLVIELDKTREELKNAALEGKGVEELKKQEESYKLKVEELERDLMFLRKKADTLAQESIKVIENLSQENESLKVIAEESKDRVDGEELEKMRKERDLLQKQVEMNVDQIRQLEEQVKTPKVADQSLNDANSLIARLNQENKELKEGLAQITIKIKSVETEVEQARKVNVQQLHEAEHTIGDLEKQIHDLNEQKKQNVDRIENLEQELGKNKEQVGDGGRMQAISVPATEKLTNDVQVPAEISSIKQVDQGGVLAFSSSETERQLSELKQANEELLEKEQFLQFELIKSQAKARGLERICEDFKNQIEHDHPTE